MAAPSLKLELCAPENPHTELMVSEVTLPGTGGVFTVHPEHTPFLSTLIPGTLVATDMEGAFHHFAVHGGFAEVKNDTVVVLANYYELSEDISDERAAAAAERAQARLRKPPEDMDWERAELALARSIARIKTSKKQGY